MKENLNPIRMGSGETKAFIPLSIDLIREGKIKFQPSILNNIAIQDSLAKALDQIENELVAGELVFQFTGSGNPTLDLSTTNGIWGTLKPEGAGLDWYNVKYLGDVASNPECACEFAVKYFGE